MNRVNGRREPERPTAHTIQRHDPVGQPHLFDEQGHTRGQSDALIRPEGDLVYPGLPLQSDPTAELAQPQGLPARTHQGVSL